MTNKALFTFLLIAIIIVFVLYLFYYNYSYSFSYTKKVNIAFDHPAAIQVPLKNIVLIKHYTNIYALQFTRNISHDFKLFNGIKYNYWIFSSTNDFPYGYHDNGTDIVYENSDFSPAYIHLPSLNIEWSAGNWLYPNQDKSLLVLNDELTNYSNQIHNLYISSTTSNYYYKNDFSLYEMAVTGKKNLNDVDIYSTNIHWIK